MSEIPNHRRQRPMRRHAISTHITAPKSAEDSEKQKQSKAAKPSKPKQSK